jgi:hypothetical protein
MRALQLYTSPMPNHVLGVGIPYQVQLALPLSCALAADPSSSSSSSSGGQATGGMSGRSNTKALADVDPMVITTWNAEHAHGLYSVHWRMLAGSQLVRLELDWVLLSQGYLEASLLGRDSLPCLRQLLLCMPDVGEIWKCLGKKAAGGWNSKSDNLLPEWLAVDSQQQQQQQQDAGAGEGTPSAAAGACSSSSTSSSAAWQQQQQHQAGGSNSGSSSSKRAARQPPRNISKVHAAADVLQRRHKLLLSCWRVLLQRGLDRLEIKGPCYQGPGWGPEALEQREASWFVGQVAELLVVLQQLQNEQQWREDEIQQKQQQQFVPVRELVLMDADGAPSHMRWLLLGNQQPQPGLESFSSSSSSGSGSRSGKRPLLSCIPRVVFDGCSCITPEVFREYVEACATAQPAAAGASAAADAEQQGEATGGKVSAEQDQQQQQLVFRCCFGLQGVALTERDACSMVPGGTEAVQVCVETRVVET